MTPEIFFTPAALATVFLAFLCAILSDARDLRGHEGDNTGVVLLLCQYSAGAGALLSFMILLWSL